MSAKTTIEWATRTWNPVRGCSRVSPGCDNCYAMKQAHRFAGPGKPYEGLTTLRGGKVDWSGVARFIPGELYAPLGWKKPERIFVNSMSDLFHHSLTREQVAAVFGVMAAAPEHRFLVLTKRPDRALKWFEWARSEADQDGGPGTATVCGIHAANHGADVDYLGLRDVWPLPNVWLGVSVEDQQRADERIPKLLRCQAVVRFLSCEPLLGQLDLRPYLHRGTHQVCPRCMFATNQPLEACPNDGAGLGPDIAIDWAIIGGESGAGARPMQLDWMRSIVQQCRDAGTACFVKQFGARPMFSQTEGYSRAIRGDAVRLLDRKGGDLTEIQGDWPREFPR